MQLQQAATYSTASLLAHWNCLSPPQYLTQAPSSPRTKPLLVTREFQRTAESNREWGPEWLSTSTPHYPIWMGSNPDYGCCAWNIKLQSWEPSFRNIPPLGVIWDFSSLRRCSWSTQPDWISSCRCFLPHHNVPHCKELLLGIALLGTIK